MTEKKDQCLNIAQNTEKDESVSAEISVALQKQKENAIALRVQKWKENQAQDDLGYTVKKIHIKALKRKTCWSQNITIQA